MVAPAIKLAVRIVAQVRLIGSSFILGFVGEFVRLSLSIGRFFSVPSTSSQGLGTRRHTNSVARCCTELVSFSPIFQAQEGRALWVRNNGTPGKRRKNRMIRFNSYDRQDR
jgi:hypothetical protein